MALPRRLASVAISVRTQSAIADAILQRRIAAGLTVTCRLSGKPTASSRTRSSPPQPPGPWMSGMLGAIAIVSVKASRQAESTGAGAAGGSAFFTSGVEDGAATVTMTARRALPLREAHLRRPFRTLDFASNRAKEPRKAIEHSGGMSPC